MCLPLEEVAVRAAHEVWMDVDNNISLILDDPRGILDEQLLHHPIHLLNIIIIRLINKIINYLIIFNDWGPSCQKPEITLKKLQCLSH